MDSGDPQDTSVKDMDPSALGKFLELHFGIALKTVKKLVKSEFSGHQLLTWEADDYSALVLSNTIGEATRQKLLQIKSNLGTGSSISPDPYILEASEVDSASSGINQGEADIRKFFTSVPNGFFYQLGCNIICKNEEPEREVFELDLTPTDKKFVMAFVKRIGPFLVGCMNRGCDGTAYFGIRSEDNKKTAGKVNGIRIPEKDRQKVQNMLNANFTHSNAKQFAGHEEKGRLAITSAFHACLFAVQFVPVKDDSGIRDLVVIEIDIKPSLQPSTTEEDFVYSLRPDPNREPIIYLRAETETILASKTRVLETRKKDIESSTQVDNLANEIEKNTDVTEETTVFKELLKQRVPSKYRYCLVTNAPGEETKSQSWLRGFNWSAVYDFGTNTPDSRLYAFMYSKEEGEGIAAAKYVLSQDLDKVTDEKNLFINCNESDAVLQTWYRQSKKKIVDSFGSEFGTRNTPFVIVLLTSMSSLKKIAVTLKEFSTYIAVEQMVCLYDNEEVGAYISQEVSDLFGESWSYQMILVASWSEVSNFFAGFSPSDFSTEDSRSSSPEQVQEISETLSLPFSPELADETSLESHAETTIDNEQSPRKFLGLVEDDLLYICGRTLPHESGASTLDEPAREYKRFDIRTSITSSPDKVEVGFVKKVGQFLLACLNRRCNGTIYFGVGDSHGGGYKHGEVVGLPLTSDSKDHFEELIKRHFTGKDPLFFRGVESDLKTAVEICVRPLKFVPVRGTDEEDLFVMELDIEPSAKTCRLFIFYVIENNAGGKKQIRNHKIKSNIPEEKHRIYYLRENSSSNRYTDLEELARKVEMYSQNRRDQEAKKRPEEIASTKNNLRRLLGNISNDEFQYILVSSVDRPDQKAFSWVADINWSLVMDFNDKSAKGGIKQHFLNNKKKLAEPSIVTAKDLTELSKTCHNSDQFLQQSNISSSSLIVQCCGYSNDWYEQEYKGLSELVLQAYDKKRFDRLDRLEVIILLDTSSNFKHIEKIVDLLRRQIAPGQFVCLSEEDATLVKFEKDMEVLGAKREKRMQRVDWSQLKEYAEEKTRKESYSGLRIISNGGMKLPLPNRVVQMFAAEKMHILAENQCEEILSMNYEQRMDYCKTGNQMIKDFLNGSTPAWRVFYLSNTSQVPVVGTVLPGVVNRDKTEEIKEDLKVNEMKLGTCVSRKRIVHQPGSGATTIARQVLWDLRKTMRCIVLDGRDFSNKNEVQDKVTTTAGRILNFRAFGEKEEIVKEEKDDCRCATVLVLLDNASDFLAKHLTRGIENEVAKRQIKHTQTIVLLLYLVSSFEAGDVSEDLMSTQFDILVPQSTKIYQKLTPKEKQLFQARLETLEKKHKNVNLEDILSFIIIAQEFNEHSEYVKRVVENSLRDMKKLFPRELQMLLYLAILKYFCDSYLPARTCFQLAFSTDDLSSQSWRSMSPQSRTFLKMRKVIDSTVVGQGNVVEVIHVPVAFQLMTTILGNKSLENVVTEILESPIIMQQTFMQDHIHSTMRKLLTNRNRELSDSGKSYYEREQFSKLIWSILKKSGREAVKRLLEKGFDSLDGNNEANVAQTLARLHYTKTHEKDNSELSIVEAKRWAIIARDLRPKRYQMSDTLGQVYKKEFVIFAEAQKESDTSFNIGDCEHILKAAATAAGFFQTAQELYANSKKSNNPDETVDPFASNFSYFGEIELNLELMKHLLLSQELSKPDIKRRLLESLRKESSEDIRIIIGPVEWVWAAYIDFLRNIYSRTEACFLVITKKLGYISAFEMNSQQRQNIWRLDKHVREFDKIFGEPGWRREIAQSISNAAKMLCLRRNLTTRIANSFGWLIRESCTENNLKMLAEILWTMERLSQMSSAGDESSLQEEDKVSYMNVAFAFAYKRWECKRLSLESIQQYCRELIQDDVNHPEPYFFFLVLNWPCNQETENLDLIIKCLKKLIKFEELYTDPYQFGIRNPTYPQFYLGIGSGFDRAFSAHGLKWGPPHGKLLTMNGRLNINKDAEIQLADGKRLTVRSAHYSPRGTEAKTVSFQVGFTFAGPKAYFKDSANTLLEMEKMTYDD